MKKIVILILIFTISCNKANAFLPPEFFVQGLSSIWSVIAGGIAVALVPFILFFKFIKLKFKQHKKIISFLLVQNIIIAIFLGVFFFYQYYQPLYQDSYLFPGGHSQENITYNIKENSMELYQELEEQSQNSNVIDPKLLNENYIILDGLLRDDIKKSFDEKYGLTPDQIKEEIDQNRKIYYIDVREPEEYEVGHIVGSKNIRYMDMERSVEKILEVFSLSEDEFKRSLIMVYCHDGNRGLAYARSINQDNVKYIIGGAEALDGFNSIDYTGSALSDKAIFDSKYQYKFQTSASEAIEIIKKGDAFVIDMRFPSLYNDKHIKDSLLFKINLTTKEKYNNIIELILSKREKKIIIIVNKYSELFYANLLILRLERDHNFDDDQFHIVFHQFEEFEKDSEIEFEGSNF